MVWRSAALATLIAAMLAACTTPEEHVQPLPTLSSPVIQATTSLPSPAVPSPDQTASAGARLTLRRSASEFVDVNALEIIDPATGSSPPPPGSRYIAVRLEISNPGGPTYTERALEGASLIDSLGVAHTAAKNEPVRGGFGTRVTVRRGGFHRGLIAFAVSQGVKPVTFLFTPQGATPETGGWRAS